MRLITQFQNEKEAYQLYSFLAKEGIQNTYELFKDPEKGTNEYRIWIYDEDDLATALEWTAKYRENPQDPIFQKTNALFVPTSSSEPSTLPLGSPSSRWKININLHPKTSGPSLTLNNFLLGLCILLFLWNNLQERKILKDKGMFALQVGQTPLQQHLLFDYPCSFILLDSLVNNYNIKEFKEIKDLPAETQAKFQEAKTYPSWKGFFDMALHWKDNGWSYLKSVPMFEKIKEGQLWRLFTPCILHKDFIHILFNLAWLWVLGRQIEYRIGAWRLALFILIVGVGSNVAQYLMSGPYFLGLSGVIVGMVGFIWSRQHIAPWEGYPLHRGTILFLVFFVAVMFALELISFILQFFSVTNFSANIGNTAHIAGGLIGALLARIPIFSRGAT